MKIFIGNDIENVSRFNKLLLEKPRLLKRIFHEVEYSYSIKSKNPDQSFTGTWCAKEAVLKAFSEIVQLTPRCIEIYRDSSGRPHCKILNEAASKFNYQIKLSISHTLEYAVSSAIVIVE